MSIDVIEIVPDKNKGFVKYRCTVCGFNGTMRKDHYKIGVGCSVCSGKKVLPGYNDVATKRPDLVRFFKTPSDALTVTINSSKKVIATCPVCGLDKDVRVCDLSRRGFKCSTCYGGFSFPNRYMSALLTKINIAFEPEALFGWSDLYRYDFYIPSVSAIIEMHGAQHYKDRPGWVSLQEIQCRDELKERLAKENGIRHYFVIPADKSSIRGFSRLVFSRICPALSLSV